MLTDNERLRALLINLDNWDWNIYPVFRIDKEDAAALTKILSQIADEGQNSN